MISCYQCQIRFRYSPMNQIETIEAWLTDLRRQNWKLCLLLPGIYVFQKVKDKDTVPDCDKIYFFTFSEPGGSDARSGGKNRCMMYAENEQLKNYGGEEVISFSGYTCFSVSETYAEQLEAIKLRRASVFREFAKEKIILELFLLLFLLFSSFVLIDWNQLSSVAVCAMLLNLFLMLDIVNNIRMIRNKAEK